jgi:hypothetical protein
MVPSRRVELGLWVALAVASVSAAVPQPEVVVGEGVDAYGTWWFFWWIRQCIEHFGDPSFTNLFFYPEGKQIFAHTGNNFVDAVLSVPFQWAFGRYYFPLFVVLTMVGNAVAFRHLADEALGERDAQGRRAFAPFAATLVWMVNPFVILEITCGRLTQAFLWFLPVAIAQLLRAARTRDTRDAVWLGVATALSAWTYWFNGYFLVVAFLTLAPFLLRAADDRRAVIRAWAIGGAVCLALVAPAVFWMAGASDDGQVIGRLRSQSVPFGGRDPTDGIPGLWRAETDTAPLMLHPVWALGLMAAMVWPLWKRGEPSRAPAFGRWVAVLVTSVIVAMGPAITDERGQVVTRFPWYRLAQDTLPYFDRLWFPYRAVVVAMVAASLLIGALLTRFGRPRLAVGIFVALLLAGHARALTWPFLLHDARVPPMVSSLRGQGGGVLVLPFGTEHDGQVWQTAFELPTFGGMAEGGQMFWPYGFSSRLNSPVVRALTGATQVPATSARWTPADRDAFTRAGFRWILLRPSSLRIAHEQGAGPGRVDPTQTGLATVRAMSMVVGRWPDGVDTDAVLWDVTGRWRPDAAWQVSEARVIETLATAPLPFR